MNGTDIWIFRLSHNMRQRELADKLGISSGLISRMENGGKVSKRTTKQFQMLIDNMKLKDEYTNLYKEK